MLIFILLIIYYLSNEDDTGNEYGNDGKAQTKILTKNFTRFFAPPLPRINVGKIYASNAGAELTKKSDTKMLLAFLTPSPSNQ